MSGQLSEWNHIDGGSINVFVAVCFATLLAFSNGANDIANSVGTAVGAGAISLRVALVIGSTSELLGCVLMGGEVQKTVGKGVVSLGEYDTHEDLLAIAMTAVLAGAGISTGLATAFGLPVSATHGAISGLTAVALFERGSLAIDDSGLGWTVFGWVASPLVGAVAAGSLATVIERRIFAAPNPAAAAHRMRPLLVGGTVALIVVFLCSKGPLWLRMPWWGAAIAAALSGTVAAFAVRNVCKIPVGVALTMFGDDAAAAPAAAAGGRAGQAPGVPPLRTVTDGPPDDAESDSWLLADEQGSEDGAVDGKELAERQFSGLLVLTGCTVAFAHGGNDLGNSTGPLLIALEHSGGAGSWMKDGASLPIFGGLCFVAGILAVGSRTIATVGSKITKLTHSSAFAVQAGATLAVLLSTAIGLPVSTSHCLVGALIGTGVAARYTPSTDGRERAPLDLKVLRKIVVAWVVTIPLAVVLALAVYVPLRATLSHPTEDGGSAAG